MVEIALDKEQFDNKPTKKQAGIITNRIVNQQVELEVNELAYALVHGQTVTALFSGTKNKTNWLGQQVVFIDFDNKDKNKKITFNAMMQRLNTYGLAPAFVYTTFSSVDNNKFRAVFILSEVVTDIRVMAAIQQGLHTVFTEADNSINPASMIYGGKTLLYNDYGATLDILKLFEAISIELQLKDNTNFSRNIKQFAKSVGLDLLNGLPYVVLENDSEMRESEDNVDSSLYIYRNVTIDSSNIVFHFNTSSTISMARKDKPKYTDVANVKVERDLIRPSDWQEIYTLCPVFRDFMNGVDIHHDVTWYIATNMAQLYGGEKRFFEGLGKRSVYDENKWIATFNHIKKLGYKAETYETLNNKTNNAYYPDITSNTNIRNTVDIAKKERDKIMQLWKNETKHLDDAERDLEEQFNYVLAQKGNGIYAIKAPTGIGKSRLYERLQDVTIAVPTHALKNEIAARMHEAGNTVIVSPSLSDSLPENIRQVIENFYLIGAISGANAFMRTMSEYYPELAEYVSQRDLSNNATGTVITTHARLPYIKANNDTIIIDEDIIATLFQQSSVTIKDILYLKQITKKQTLGKRSKGYTSALHSLLDTVLESKPHLVYELPPATRISNVDLREIENEIIGKSLSSNVLGLLNSSHYIIEDDTCYFISRRSLPENKKIIVLSATMSENLYRLAFGDRLNYYDIGCVETKGKLTQIVNIPASRDALSNNPDALELVTNLVNDNPVITYKAFMKYFTNPVGSFGAVLGLNNLAGTDKLYVVGTPHLNPIAYVLLASSLGIKVTQRDLAPLNFTKTLRNGFQFNFMTYSQNDLLQEVQLYLIESELVQSIGRARLLRFPVEVILISNLPIENAVITYVDNVEKVQLLSAV